MRMLKQFVLSLSLALCLPSLASAQDQTEPAPEQLTAYDIMRRIADSHFTGVKTLPPAFAEIHAPQDWRFSSHSNDQCAFTIPYHKGVAVFIQRLHSADEITSQANLVAKQWASSHHIALDEWTWQEQQNSLLAITTGRIAGSVWKFMLFVKKDAENILFFAAQTPQRWFDAYEPLLNRVRQNIRLNHTP